MVGNKSFNFRIRPKSIKTDTYANHIIMGFWKKDGAGGGASVHNCFDSGFFKSRTPFFKLGYLSIGVFGKGWVFGVKKSCNLSLNVKCGGWFIKFRQLNFFARRKKPLPVHTGINLDVNF